MGKSQGKTTFVCDSCGWQSSRWAGRCAECGQWNTMVEFTEPKKSSPAFGRSTLRSQPQLVSQVSPDPVKRIGTGMGEFDQVLGGGIVPGSVVLVSGDPGIGKSTLLLQLSANVSRHQGQVLYVSGEESPQQIKMRADRLGIQGDRLLLLGETCVDNILEAVSETKPAVVVVDSVQTMYVESVGSAPGGVTQVRESAATLLRMAKEQGIPVFLVGHVTKDGDIAGPRILEHIVDTVLYLEGERFQSYRLLRVVKNRFGSSNEVGVFEMRGEGMVEVANASELFLSEREDALPGSAVIATLEGTRPILIEAQALTASTSFGLPRRTANGFDYNRLVMLTAVLTKRVGLGLSSQDVYVNAVGGMKVSEPAADLGVALAIASSYADKPLSSGLVAIGEVGLSGELRRVGQLERRLAEAAKLGFSRCLVPASCRTILRSGRDGLEIMFAQSVREAVSLAMR